FTDAVTDQVQTDHRAVGDAHQLDRAGGLEDLALAVASEVVGEGLDRAVLLLGGGLGEPHGGDFGVAVGDARNACLVDRLRVESSDVFGDEDALLETAVRQLQAGDDVAHRVDARQVRAQPLVGADEAAFELHAGLFEAVASGVRAAADGNQHDVGLELLAVLQADGDAGVGLLRAGELHAGLELDAAPAEGSLQALGDELVLVGDQVRQRFDDRDFSAEGTPHAGELHADHAAAQHDDLLGHEVEVERLLAGDDPTAQLEAGDRLRVRAGRQYDVLAGVPGAVDFDRVGVDKGSGAFDQGDLVRLGQPLQALVEACDDVLLVLVDAVDVDAFERGFHPELVGVPSGVGHLRGVQQCLGGNTPAVQASPTELVLFDEDDGQAKLGCAEGAGVAAGTAAENDQIGGRVGHFALLDRHR